MCVVFLITHIQFFLHFYCSVAAVCSSNIFLALFNTFLGQSEWCNLTSQKGDDVQVVFYPTLQHLMAKGFKINNEKQAFAAFQLNVKPGAYSTTRESEIVEWSTKENGAIALNSLLIKFVNL